MERRKNFDAIIIGAGSVGLPTAYFLALEGLSVLEGDIASNIDETYTLVQEKLAAFETMISGLVTE